MLNNTTINKNSKREEAAILNKRIKDLETQHFTRVRDTVATSFFLYGETVTNKQRTQGKGQYSSPTEIMPKQRST